MEIDSEENIKGEIRLDMIGKFVFISYSKPRLIFTKSIDTSDDIFYYITDMNNREFIINKTFIKNIEKIDNNFKVVFDNNATISGRLKLIEAKMVYIEVIDRKNGEFYTYSVPLRAINGMKFYYEDSKDDVEDD